MPIDKVKSTPLLLFLEERPNPLLPIQSVDPRIDVAVIDVSLKERWRLYRNGPYDGEYFRKYLLAYLEKIDEYVQMDSQKSFYSGDFRGIWDGGIYRNAGALKANLMYGEGILTDEKTGRSYRHTHFVYETMGIPYVISFFGPNEEEHKRRVWKIANGFDL